MGYNIDLNNDGAADPGSDNLFVKLLMNQQAASEPTVSAPDSGVNMVSLMDKANELFPSQDAERKALLAKREELTGPDAMKKKAGVMMGGLGLIGLLSVLGGAKGRAGMGNAMQAWGQGFQSADKSMTDLQTGQIDKQLATTDQAVKDRGNVLKSLLLRGMMQQGKTGAAAGAGGVGTDHLRGMLLQKQAAGMPLTADEQKVLGQLTPSEKSTELPSDVRAFQAFNPGVNIGTPEGRKAYIEWNANLRNDPYMGYAVQQAGMNQATVRMNPQQLSTWIVNMRDSLKDAASAVPQTVPNNVFQNLRFNGGGLPNVPTYRYDAQGNRVQ